MRGRPTQREVRGRVRRRDRCNRRNYVELLGSHRGGGSETLRKRDGSSRKESMGTERGNEGRPETIFSSREGVSDHSHSAGKECTI